MRSCVLQLCVEFKGKTYEGRYYLQGSKKGISTNRTAIAGLASALPKSDFASVVEFLVYVLQCEYAEIVRTESSSTASTASSATKATAERVSSITAEERKSDEEEESDDEESGGAAAAAAAAAATKVDVVGDNGLEKLREKHAETDSWEDLEW